MLRLPALDPATIDQRTTTNYPSPHDALVRGRAKRSLTAALGLTQFGVNVTELAPGAASALRHWHSHEDEFVYVLEGEPTLVTNEGEQQLKPGQCAGFPGGAANGHQLVNRTSKLVRFLEVGTRSAADTVIYSDVDMRLERDGAERRYLHKSGAPYPK